MMLLGFPSGVWITMAVEFTERLGYYGTTFMLMMYCTSMLRWNPSTGNAVINGLYAATPAAACISSIVSDGHWGRPFSLVVSLATYAGGLSLVAISSYPFMYDNFPLEPTVGSLILFAFGIAFFAIGYGGMKVCTNPLMADIVSEAYKDSEQEREAVVSQLFRWIYVVTNTGSLVGIFVPPLLRSLDKRSVKIGSVLYTTGFYLGFTVSAASCLLGLLLFSAMYRRFHKNKPVPEFVLVRVFFRAICMRWYFATGRVRDDAFLSAHRWDLFDYAGYSVFRDNCPDVTTSHTVLLNPPGSSVEPRSSVEKGLGGAPTSIDCEPLAPKPDDDAAKQDEESSHRVSHHADELEQVWVDDAKSIVSVCRVLVAVPVYWLITNQFSTNMILQASATSLPPQIPPEIFNNVNTVALLVSLVFFDRVLFPRMFPNRCPPMRGRVVVGCAIMIISMLWCGFVQLGIDHRGMYDEDDFYHLYPGMEMVPSGWLVLPYTMQGVASALVDTTILEVTYVAAPTGMKGAVMGMYLLASSLSGFLGLAISPVLRPTNAKLTIFSLTGALVPVTILFYFLNSPPAGTRTPSEAPPDDAMHKHDTVPKCEGDSLLNWGRSRMESSGRYGGVPQHEDSALREPASANPPGRV
ncbi:proton-dependent oligopeptide transporter, POT family [Trypanosoma rangeli]|uniref:Proton-dependent oligopeptide transporter, POT family n=1 Tax=Trypanosoma rangeli TaxID=5698 RepID=A0A422P2J5_TRYRA|nr:proton-dependent oligopeptide transporter, POT family [Trypanosoma rangeli]RNF11950.1 proton-dependent oligopeptide transporter, POT family [Trypanosoma rangeli]|eukprot:RNF11950.1 proton-dependent oligopeptide transporter, POT family [Trypanosoma rangeli]